MIMRKIISVLLCLFTLMAFCSCNTTKESETTATTACDRTVTIINRVNEASIWVLSDTEANRKTTVWGTPTIKTAVDESCHAGIDKPGDNGLYIFRMIDIEKMYYSSDNIALEDGWTLEIKQESTQVYVIEVTDKDGNLNATYEVFAASL
jgi:hypothetical protein